MTDAEIRAVALATLRSIVPEVEADYARLVTLDDVFAYVQKELGTL